MPKGFSGGWSHSTLSLACAKVPDSQKSRFTSQSSPEKQNQQDRGVRTEIRGGLLWGLVHLLMEAEKSHDLLPASWRPRKASGVIQSQSEGLRIRWGADGVRSGQRTEGANVRGGRQRMGVLA